MLILLILFAASALWIYGGYAAFIAFIARYFPVRLYCAGEPGVSVIVPSFNEEKVIAARLDNLLGQAYPAGKLEIIVADSGSTDRTREIVAGYAARGVRLLAEPERRGKGAAIASAARGCSHDIIVVTDANSYFEPGALRELAGHFADPAVGGATGCFSLKDAPGRPGSAGSAFFREYENLMRESEERIDSCVSLFGEMFACRKSLLEVDERNLTEDFDSSVAIRRKGYRLAYAAKAKVFEYAPSSEGDLFLQRRRVLTGTLQTLWKRRAALFNPKYGFYGTLILPGHKLFPVFSPFFLAGTMALFAALYPFLFLLFAAVFVSCGLLQRDLFRFLRYVILVNFACVCAWKDFLTGNFTVKWRKMESTRIG